MATPTRTPITTTRPVPAFQQRRIQRLSDPENAQFLADMKDRIRNEPEFAQRMLQGAGILDAEGKLTQPYRD
jgi:hypothetical protein